MKEKVSGTKIIALIILLSIAIFSILTSKYIMTMKGNYIKEDIDYNIDKYLYDYTERIYKIEK